MIGKGEEQRGKREACVVHFVKKLIYHKQSLLIPKLLSILASGSNQSTKDRSCVACVMLKIHQCKLYDKLQELLFERDPCNNKQNTVNNTSCWYSVSCQIQNTMH